MQNVPWDQIHSSLPDFKTIFRISQQNSEPSVTESTQEKNAAVYVDIRQWERVYPYVAFLRSGSAQRNENIVRIVGPALRFKNYVSGANSRKFVLSALVTLNVQFLHFLETFDSAIAAQVTAIPGYERRKFQGLIKTTQNQRVLELQIDENTDFFVCDRNTGVVKKIDREAAMRSWAISRAPCKPQFRIDNWFIHHIFQSVRLKIVCESLTFYPGREWMLTPSRSLESLENRYRVYRETGYDVDLDNEVLEEEDAPVEEVEIISVETEEEKRLKFAIKDNVACGWCPPLSAADENLTVEWEDENVCCICLCNCCNAYLMPCEHRCVCIPCAQQLLVRQCPICRSRVEKVLRVQGNKK